MLLFSLNKTNKNTVMVKNCLSDVNRYQEPVQEKTEKESS
jgi:hypothetical protein